MYGRREKGGEEGGRRWEGAWRSARVMNHLDGWTSYIETCNQRICYK
jgi:hypothetical protein